MGLTSQCPKSPKANVMDLLFLKLVIDIINIFCSYVLMQLFWMCVSTCLKIEGYQNGTPNPMGYKPSLDPLGNFWGSIF